MKDQGENTIARQKKTSELLIFLCQFKTSIVLILVAATFISFLSSEWIDAAIILVMVPSSSVLRNGTLHGIPARLLVQGDLIRLSGGSLIPADRYLLKTMGLQLNQSILSGESMPLMKQVGPVPLMLFACLEVGAYTLVLPYLPVGGF